MYQRRSLIFIFDKIAKRYINHKIIFFATPRSILDLGKYFNFYITSRNVSTGTFEIDSYTATQIPTLV